MLLFIALYLVVEIVALVAGRLVARRGVDVAAAAGRAAWSGSGSPAARAAARCRRSPRPYRTAHRTYRAHRRPADRGRRFLRAAAGLRVRPDRPGLAAAADPPAHPVPAGGCRRATGPRPAHGADPAGGPVVEGSVVDRRPARWRTTGCCPPRDRKTTSDAAKPPSARGGATPAAAPCRRPPRAPSSWAWVRKRQPVRSASVRSAPRMSAPVRSALRRSAPGEVGPDQRQCPADWRRRAARLAGRPRPGRPRRGPPTRCPGHRRTPGPACWCAAAGH